MLQKYCTPTKHIVGEYPYRRVLQRFGGWARFVEWFNCAAKNSAYGDEPIRNTRRRVQPGRNEDRTGVKKGIGVAAELREYQLTLSPVFLFDLSYFGNFRPILTLF